MLISVVYRLILFKILSFSSHHSKTSQTAYVHDVYSRQTYMIIKYIYMFVCNMMFKIIMLVGLL